MLKYIIAIVFLAIVSPSKSDTLIRQGCSKDYPGVQWFIWEDDDGNRYSTKNPRSRKCGFSRNLNLSMVKEYGDRFDPAIVDVDYKDMLDRDEPWGMADHSTTIGRAVRVDKDTVHIFGDGRTGDGIFTLGKEEIQFRIEDEPVCEVIPSWPGGGGIDCEGYTQRTNQDLIYYGEEDEKIVTWELGILVYASHRKYGTDVPIEILEEYEVDSTEWNKHEEIVEKYNEVYERSGVYIRFKLAKLYLAHWHSLYDISTIAARSPVDILLGVGTSYPDTCGVAKVKTHFREGRKPYSMSRCGIYTDLHEIGHSVGLAHGPENQANPASGYIFSQFGHGWNDVCRTKDDLMSYGYEGYFHTNSKLYCDEIWGGNNSYPAGGREYSDTAHALNRIRYDVSLINRENDYIDPNQRTPYERPSINPQEIEVID